ncbi:polymorphic toxin type 10 domain-containing protein [Leptospira noguchii]|uniref:polymorphic toxin type 10 domain-containing protein n=1 Tax=Leptospira noguchii TaxID=28182 RepID=UPI001FB719DE|nr:polymorphic toxin type 10 domain-containing protein [Leptospira noguchii]UOG32740.1 polymorphic toxin type 10 domain-containing protein [Leptospira noguchii]
MRLRVILCITFLAYNLLTGAESPVSEKQERSSNVEYNKTLKYKTTFLRKPPYLLIPSHSPLETYDESGFRIRKSSLEPKNNVFSNVEILYPSKFFGLEFIESENVITSVNNVYLNGVRIAALNEAGALAYYLTDQVDSVSTVLDDEGNTLSQMQYLPYGETFVQRGDLNFSPKFNSQELDRESGFYFYNARYYDPGIGRFTSADTLIPDEYNSQAWNRFAYVYNNPIGAKDPTGHAPQDYDAGFKDSSKGIVKGTVDSVKSALSAPTPVNAAVNSAVATGKGVYDLAKDYKGTYNSAKDFAGKLTSKDDKVRDYAAGQAAAHTMSAVLGGMAGKALGSKLPKPKTDLPGGGASSATNSVKLNKSLASEAQMNSKGTAIFKSDKLKQADNLSKQYGGKSDDWAKMTSKSYTAKDGTKFETHWYENTSTGQRVEPKTKLSK